MTGGGDAAVESGGRKSVSRREAQSPRPEAGREGRSRIRQATTWLLSSVCASSAVASAAFPAPSVRARAKLTQDVVAARVECPIASKRGKLQHGCVAWDDGRIIGQRPGGDDLASQSIEVRVENLRTEIHRSEDKAEALKRAYIRKAELQSDANFIRMCRIDSGGKRGRTSAAMNQFGSQSRARSPAANSEGMSGRNPRTLRAFLVSIAVPRGMIRPAS